MSRYFETKTNKTSRQGKRVKYIAILLLTALIAFTAFGIWQIKQDESAPAENLLITNVTSNSFSVVWESSEAYSAEVAVKESSERWAPLFPAIYHSTNLDDRDKYLEERPEFSVRSFSRYLNRAIGANTPKQRYSHHVTITGLLPETDYDIALLGKISQRVLNAKPVRTKRLALDLQTPNPAYGMVKNAQVNESVIVLDLDNGEFLSTYLAANGTYSIDLANRPGTITYRQSDLQALVYNGSQGIFTHKYKSRDYQPYETIELAYSDDGTGEPVTSKIPTGTITKSVKAEIIRTTNKLNAVDSQYNSYAEVLDISRRNPNFNAGNINDPGLDFVGIPPAGSGGSQTPTTPAEPSTPEVVEQVEPPICLDPQLDSPAIFAEGKSTRGLFGGLTNRVEAAGVQQIQTKTRTHLTSSGQPLGSSGRVAGASSEVEEPKVAGANSGPNTTSGQTNLPPEKITLDESGRYAFFVDNQRASDKDITINPETGTVDVRIYYDNNANGKKDPNEEYISDYSKISFEKDASLQDYDLNAGWNLINIPMIDTRAEGRVEKASDLIEYWRTQGAEIKHVTRYVNGKFEFVTKRESGVTYAADFNLLPGEPLFVFNAGGNSRVTFSGNKYAESVPVKLTNGWNLVSFNKPAKELTAGSTLFTMVDKGIDASTLSSYDNGLYSSVILEDEVLFGNNYNILPTKGYFVRVEGNAQEITF